MKFLLRIVLFICLPVVGVANENECNDRACLVCDGLAEEHHYAEGIMKAMRFIAPGKGTWLFRSDYDLSNDFGLPKPYRKEFRRLIQAFRDQGTEVVMIVQPTRGLMQADSVDPGFAYGFDFAEARKNYQRFLKQLAKEGAVVPDLMPLLSYPRKQDYFFRRDHHWTPAGAAETARMVADTIIAMPVYDELEKKAYITEPGTYLPKDGTMNGALRRICGNNFGFQYVPGFQTVPAESGEDALFGDASDPQVVLVGTSNSAERDDDYKNYNFSGFLKEYLSLDILNYSLPGGGQDGAIQQYLLSPEYDPANAPKLVFWELPASYHLDDPLMYRQLLPAIKGGCSTASAKLMEASHDIGALPKGERVEILSNAGRAQKNLKGTKGFFELTFSNKNVKDFYLITYYDNGERDKVWYRRPNVVDGGTYHLELSQESQFRKANLMSVFFEPSEPMEEGTHMEISLCR